MASDKELDELRAVNEKLKRDVQSLSLRITELMGVKSTDVDYAENFRRWLHTEMTFQGAMQGAKEYGQAVMAMFEMAQKQAFDSGQSEGALEIERLKNVDKPYEKMVAERDALRVEVEKYKNAYEGQTSNLLMTQNASAAWSEDCEKLRTEVETLRRENESFKCDVNYSESLIRDRNTAIRERDEARAERDDALDKLRICGECATTLRKSLENACINSAQPPASSPPT